MCGLVGFSGPNNYNPDKIKLLMLWNSEERGKDATGIYTPSSGLLKDNTIAKKFFLQKEMEKLKLDNQLIAHVRQKTVGANLARSAHPFDDGDIILAHNGTLLDYHQLAVKYEMKAADWDVDSQILAKAVNEAFNKLEDLKDLSNKIPVFSEYKGAAALLFYSKSFDTMFVFKDKERTLFYGYDENGGMYISSIEEALKVADLFEVKAFDNNTLYHIDHGDIISTTKYETYADLHKNEFNGKVRRREKGQKFPKLKKGIRELSVVEDDWKSYWYTGLWLMCDQQLFGFGQGKFGKLATLKMGFYYLITGWFDEDSLEVQVKDHEGKECVASLTHFDIEDAIPQEGDYFRFTTNIIGKESKKLLWSKDEVVILDEYDIVNGLLSIYHTTTGKFFDINPSSCKRMTLNEVESYFKKENPSDSETPIDNSTDEEKELPIIDTLPEESPFKDENDTKKLGDFIDTKAYLGILDTIGSKVDSLEEDYDMNLDITPKINDVRLTIDSGKDKAYLENIAK